MPRQARLVGDGLIYHVMVRGNNRDCIFRDDQDFSRYFDLCLKYKEQYRLKIYHWVFMNNHVHFLVEPAEGRALSKAMQGIGLSFAIWSNRKYKRVGHLWQDRFKSQPVESTAYLLECGRYIERNPVRSGMVRCASEYRWSSYRVHGCGQDDRLTDAHKLLETFGADQKKRQKAYREYVMTSRDREEEELRKRMSAGVIGNEDFVDRLHAENLTRRRRKRGRPRKAT